MKIILTGATGFIGSHLIRALYMDTSNKLIILKRSTSDTWRLDKLNQSIVSNQIKFYDVDVTTDFNIIFKENPDIDMVIHLAAYYNPTITIDTIDAQYLANVVFPIKVFTLAQQYGVKNFISTASMFEFGESDTLPTFENSRKNPINLHGVSKMSFDMYLKEYFCKRFDVKVAVVNLFSPYGPLDKPIKIVQIVIDCILNNKPLKMSEGFQKLDWIYVADVVNAYLTIIREFDHSLLPGYESFNIATGLSYSIRDMVSLLEEITDTHIKKEYNNNLFTGVRTALINVDKARDLLGWKSQISLRQGLQYTYNYYKDLKDGKI